jgi:hypothetical protein
MSQIMTIKTFLITKIIMYYILIGCSIIEIIKIGISQAVLKLRIMTTRRVGPALNLEKTGEEVDIIEEGIVQMGHIIAVKMELEAGVAHRASIIIIKDSSREVVAEQAKQE